MTINIEKERKIFEDAAKFVISVHDALKDTQAIKFSSLAKVNLYTGVISNVNVCFVDFPAITDDFYKHFESYWFSCVYDECNRKRDEFRKSAKIVADAERAAFRVDEYADVVAKSAFAEMQMQIYMKAIADKVTIENEQSETIKNFVLSVYGKGLDVNFSKDVKRVYDAIANWHDKAESLTQVRAEIADVLPKFWIECKESGVLQYMPLATKNFAERLACDMFSESKVQKNGFIEQKQCTLEKFAAFVCLEIISDGQQKHRKVLQAVRAVEDGVANDEQKQIAEKYLQKQKEQAEQPDEQPNEQK